MTTLPKTFCFVLMPFDSSFNDIYQLGIKEACRLAGAYCERVDEQIFRESMLERIYNQIAKSDVVISDMTGRNPNVFYETGYAHALGKTVILLTQNADDIPFDLKHYPHIVYGGQIVHLQSELRRQIQWHLDNPNLSAAETQLSLHLYANGNRLSREHETDGNAQTATIIGTGSTLNMKVDVHNSAEHTFRTVDFAIGMITSSLIHTVYHGSGRDRTRWKAYDLPDDTRYHRADFEYHLMAGDWDSFNLKFRARHGHRFEDGSHERLCFRVFSDERFFDFLTLARVTRGTESTEADEDVEYP